MAGVTVRGLADLETGLERAGRDMRDLTAAHPRVADLIARAVNPPKLSGRLAASIRPDVATGQALVHAGGVGAPYAGIIEFGAPRRNITGRHYMRKAMQRTESAALNIYADELQTILDRAV